NNAFQLGRKLERFKCFGVQDGHVFDPAGIAQPRVFRPYTRIVEPCRDRVTVDNLAVLILKQVGTITMQDAWTAGVHGGAMLVTFQTAATSFHADDLDALVVEEGMEDADCIRTAANRCDHNIWKPAFLLQNLLACFVANHRLEFTHELRIRVRTSGSADEIVGIFDVRDPITQRLIHSILERAMTGTYRLHLCTQKLHAENVRLLTLNVGGAHIDDTRQAETCCHGGGCNAVLASTRLRDDARLAHAFCEQDLAEAVVDLVAASVVQVLALEEYLRAAKMAGEVFGMVELGGTTSVMGGKRLQFRLKLRVCFRLVPMLFQIKDQGHERFSYEAPAEDAEHALLIRTGPEGIWFNRLGHAAPH